MKRQIVPSLIVMGVAVACGVVGQALVPADASSPAYSISTEDCGGGISIQAGSERSTALQLVREVRQQDAREHGPASVKLFHNGKLVVNAHRAC